MGCGLEAGEEGSPAAQLLACDLAEACAKAQLVGRLRRYGNGRGRAVIHGGEVEEQVGEIVDRTRGQPPNYIDESNRRQLGQFAGTCNP